MAAWYTDRLAERLSGYGSSEGGGGVIFDMAMVSHGINFGETFEMVFAVLLRKAPPGNGGPTKLNRSTDAFRAYQRIDVVVLDGAR